MVFLFGYTFVLVQLIYILNALIQIPFKLYPKRVGETPEIFIILKRGLKLDQV
jgi:hypothetical protein